MSVRVAVVGAGAWGKNHVRTFASLSGEADCSAELVAVCDRSPAVREKIAASYGVTTYASLSECIEEVDAVVIATSAETHFDLAEQALTAGKDVLVEKPLTLTGERAETLCSLAEEKGAVLMVGHLLLFHSAVQELKKRIDAGELGDIHYLVCRRLNLGVVRQHENAWWSLAPHDISIANYLLSAEPTAVSATSGTFLQNEVEDVVFATLRYGDDRLAHMHVSWLDPHKVRSFTVVGSKKMASFDDTSPDRKLVLFDKGVEPPRAVSYEEGVRIRTGDIQIPAIRMSEPLKAECRAFLKAIETREIPVASGRSGLSVVRALEAGQKSMDNQGQEVAIGE